MLSQRKQSLREEGSFFTQIAEVRNVGMLCIVPGFFPFLTSLL